MLAGNIGLCNLQLVLKQCSTVTSKVRALQLDQLSEQIPFLFDYVWCTLQSNDTNFCKRFELQLN